MSIGERIADIRQSRGLSVQELAQLISVRPQFIINIEDGTQKAHTLTYRKIADALHVPLEMLIQGSYSPPGEHGRMEDVPEAYRWLVKLVMGLTVLLGTLWLLIAVTVAASSFFLWII